MLEQNQLKKKNHIFFKVKNGKWGQEKVAECKREKELLILILTEK